MLLITTVDMSETKIKVDHDLITNVDIPGYNFISQPSLSNIGGVGNGFLFKG
jgi:hypothetical protein